MDITTVGTDFGYFEVQSKNDIIYSAQFIDELDSNSTSNPYMKKLVKDYFLGRGLSHYHCKLDGTPFQISVWKEIIKIPYGETRTYSEIAEAIGKPNSYRAVASACSANRIAIMIPCHRVVGKKNKNGYKWGKKIKNKLLKLEKIEISNI